MKLYKKFCDGSAGFAIDAVRFLVANDETEVINLYRNDNDVGDPIEEFDFTAELHGEDDDRECDLEGAASIDGTIYWIGSHGRNRKGKLRHNRHRLFATRVRATGNNVQLEWIGRYDRLAYDMCDMDCWPDDADAITKDIVSDLTKATRLAKPKVKRLAPKKQGLNIEGLAARPDGSALLLGLRNPIPDERALIIPVLNPLELVSGEDDECRFGTPVKLDLHGLGIRSLGYVPAIEAYLIIAGPNHNGGPYHLYRWSGDDNDDAVFDHDLQETWEFAPEAIVTYGTSNRVQLLGDGGSVLLDGEECKERADAEKYFSDRWHYLV